MSANGSGGRGSIQLNNPRQNRNDEPEERAFVDGIRASMERLSFNEKLRGPLADQFTEAHQNGSIHDIMISDALGHPVAFRALQIFLGHAKPGTFDDQDLDEIGFPVFTPSRLAEQQRYNQIVIEQLRIYASLSIEERATVFQPHPQDLEPNLTNLIAQLDQGKITATEVLHLLTSR